jgi:hypothetical protein
VRKTSNPHHKEAIHDSEAVKKSAADFLRER